MTKNTPDFARVASIAQEVNLQSVLCRELSAKRTVEATQIPKLIQCGTTYEATGLRDIVASQIVVVIRFSFSASDANTSPAERVAEVNATMSLRYSVQKEILQNFSPEAVQDFAQINGVYNAWPYWRELLQSTTTRLGLPGLVIPVFRVAKEGKEKKSEERKSAEHKQ